MNIEQDRFAETPYEQQLSWNAVSAWFHSLRFKAILDVFPTGPTSVVEIGCAGGQLFQTLNARFDISYTGIDNDASGIDTARSRYGALPNFRALCGDALQELDRIPRPDVLVALETLEHIPAGNVVRLIEKIGALRPRLFICSVPVEIGPFVWAKNVGSAICGYHRHKHYTWSETWYAGIGRLDKLPPHECAHKGFDWRWLTQTIRGHLQIVEFRKLPLQWLPPSLSTSIFIVAKPYQPDSSP